MTEGHRKERVREKIGGLGQRGPWRVSSAEGADEREVLGDATRRSTMFYHEKSALVYSHLLL